jgi:hypothetical protein
LLCLDVEDLVGKQLLLLGLVFRGVRLVRLEVGFVDGHVDDVLRRVAYCESLGKHLAVFEGTCFFL